MRGLGEGRGRVVWRAVEVKPRAHHCVRRPQEPDLRYLVENIWNSQSALSAHDDLFDLVLSRWNKHEEWSPWNCVLLTKEEANAHAKLENVNEVKDQSVLWLFVFIGRRIGD